MAHIRQRIWHIQGQIPALAFREKSSKPFKRDGGGSGRRLGCRVLGLGVWVLGLGLREAPCEQRLGGASDPNGFLATPTSTPVGFRVYGGGFGVQGLGCMV